jgi:aryl-alcohol dehydrogenase-like predicted oxidoreductase
VSDTTSSWLAPDEPRVGLGCMRLPPDTAAATIAAAAGAGITVFDTARAYDGNERLVAGTLRACGAHKRARIVTKGGMSRAGGGWVPDGRAKTIRADCEASLAALDGLAIDLYLIHAPDPRTSWRTSVRALARLVDDGLVRRVGVANVNRRQVDEALELAPVAAVQVALSLSDERALRGGMLERCVEAGIALVAHSPLGGPRAVGRLLRNQALSAVAERHGATPGEVALAWLLALSPAVLAIPGARRPETARSGARAATLELDDDDLAALAPRPTKVRRRRGGAEVVLVMGIPGAGKSRLADSYVARGFRRLNRDERGGSLRELADALDEELAAGERRLVLDNTYLTRAERSYVVEAALRQGASARCVWLDTPLAQAQVNLVERLLDRFGSLPTPEQLRAARGQAGLLLPTSQMRTLRELEPPTPDEGFAAVEQVAFERVPSAGTAGVFVAAAALAERDWRRVMGAADPALPHLVFDWAPDGSMPDTTALVQEVGGPVEAAVCPHPGGPPSCWCRPPLPGLPLAFARRHGVEPTRSIVVGVSATHRTLAATLGARYVSPRATTA